MAVRAHQLEEWISGFRLQDYGDIGQRVGRDLSLLGVYEDLEWGLLIPELGLFRLVPREFYEVVGPIKVLEGDFEILFKPFLVGKPYNFHPS